MESPVRIFLKQILKKDVSHVFFCNFSVINFDKVVLKCDFHDPKAYQQIPASPLFRLIYNIHNQSQNQKKLHTFRFF